jgi:hypothetical protein
VTAWRSEPQCGEQWVLDIQQSTLLSPKSKPSTGNHAHAVRGVAHKRDVGLHKRRDWCNVTLLPHRRGIRALLGRQLEQALKDSVVGPSDEW